MWVYQCLDILSTVVEMACLYIISGIYNVLNLSKIPHILIFFSLTIFILIFLIVFLYSKNTMFLREQEQNSNISKYTQYADVFTVKASVFKG